MITPNLFDIATIIVLRPTWKIFYPNERNKDTINFKTDRASFGHHIFDHYDIVIAEVFNEEHIAFLALWLSHCIFFCKSLKMEKRFLTLANQQHEGQNIFLSQLILGSLYETLGLAIDSLKTLKPRTNFLLAGPYWLLQLWINAMFEPYLQIDKQKDNDEEIKNRRVKGVRLALMTHTDNGRTLQEVFTRYIMMFMEHQIFTSSMAPFSNRTYGPK